MYEEPKKPVGTTKKVVAPVKKKDESSEESDSDSSDEEVKPATKPAPAKNGSATAPTNRGIRPPMTLPVLIQVFCCSIVGLTLNQITYFVGLKNSTPTIACALSNLLLSITFVLAVIFKRCMA